MPEDKQNMSTHQCADGPVEVETTWSVLKHIALGCAPQWWVDMRVGRALRLRVRREPLVGRLLGLSESECKHLGGIE